MTNPSTGRVRAPRDESVEILRRVETMLAALADQVGHLDRRVDAIDGEMRELKGRVSMLSPAWRLIGPLALTMMAVMACAAGLVALVRFAAGP